MGLSHAYLANLEFLASDFLAAEREACAALESLGDVPPLRAGALAVLARALLAQGRADAALDAACEAHVLLESLGTIEEGETAVRLVYAEALLANGHEEEFSVAIGLAHKRLLAKAERIHDAAGRELFLKGIADNARTLMLASGSSG